MMRRWESDGRSAVILSNAVIPGANAGHLFYTPKIVADIFPIYRKQTFEVIWCFQNGLSEAELSAVFDHEVSKMRARGSK